MAHPGEDAIDAIWAGWDEPGIGAQLSLEAAGRKGIVVAGIDGNPHATGASWEERAAPRRGLRKTLASAKPRKS